MLRPVNVLTQHQEFAGLRGASNFNMGRDPSHPGPFQGGWGWDGMRWGCMAGKKICFRRQRPWKKPSSHPHKTYLDQRVINLRYMLWWRNFFFVAPGLQPPALNTHPSRPAPLLGSSDRGGGRGFGTGPITTIQSMCHTGSIFRSPFLGISLWQPSANYQLYDSPGTNSCW